MKPDQKLFEHGGRKLKWERKHSLFAAGQLETGFPYEEGEAKLRRIKMTGPGSNRRRETV